MGSLLLSPPLDAPRQMALDEAVLEEPGLTLALRFFDWPGPALTFGYFQPHAEAASAAAREGIEGPVRRPTGGGIVVHKGDVTFSLVFPWDERLTPQAFYKNLHRGIHLHLKAARLATRLLSPAAAGAGPRLDCFADPSACDLIIDTPDPSPPGAKVLGGALRKRKGRGLYQGSFRLPAGWDRPTVRRAIEAGTADVWSQAWQATDLPPDVSSRAEALAASRYGTREWNEKR